MATASTSTRAPAPDGQKLVDQLAAESNTLGMIHAHAFVEGLLATGLELPLPSVEGKHLCRNAELQINLRGNPDGPTFIGIPTFVESVKVLSGLPTPEIVVMGTLDLAGRVGSHLKWVNSFQAFEQLGQDRFMYILYPAADAEDFQKYFQKKKQPFDPRFKAIRSFEDVIWYTAILWTINGVRLYENPQTMGSVMGRVIKSWRVVTLVGRVGDLRIVVHYLLDVSTLARSCSFLGRAA